MSHLSGCAKGPALTPQASCSNRDSTILYPHPQGVIRVSQGSPTIKRPGAKPLLSCLSFLAVTEDESLVFWKI